MDIRHIIKGNWNEFKDLRVGIYSSLPDPKQGGLIYKIPEGNLYYSNGSTWSAVGGIETDPIFNAWLSSNPFKTINGESLLGTGDITVTVQTIRKHDFNSGYSYCGTAPINSLDSDSVWKITRITIPSSGDNLITQTLNSVKWSDRYTLTYP